MAAPKYTVHAVSTPLPSQTTQQPAASEREAQEKPGKKDPFLRPACEDDDGYDPFSDRPPTPEPAFQEDPWS